MRHLEIGADRFAAWAAKATEISHSASDVRGVGSLGLDSMRTLMDRRLDLHG